MSKRVLIEPRSGWQAFDLAELVRYRDLFFLLVLRDLTVMYKQTALGFGWAIIRPTFSVLIFSVVFGGLADVQSDGVPYPLFSMAAVLPWTYFQTALTKSTTSLVAASNMLSKIYFPRVFIPLTPIFAGLVDFAIASVLLGILMAWYGVVPPPQAAVVPLLILLMVLTVTGIGLWLASLAAQYRDVNQAMPFLTQIFMYAAPVVWPVSLIDAQFEGNAELVRFLYGLYPMAAVIEGFRSCLLGTTPVPWDLIAVGSASAAVIAVSGALYFRRAERTFADVV